MLLKEAAFLADFMKYMADLLGVKTNLISIANVEMNHRINAHYSNYRQLYH